MLATTQSKTAGPAAGTQTAASKPPRAVVAPVANPQQLPSWATNWRCLQFSLKVNTPGDPYEREADWVADRVMRMTDTTVQRKTCACGRPAGPDGLCEECQRNQLNIQRKTAGDAGPTTAPAIVQQALQQPGRPLDSATRHFMESRFGQDFGRVRVHTDGPAAASAEAVSARAYTHGPNIVFDAGEYAPHTAAGQTLLAHELAHTIQQGAVDSVPRAGSSPGLQRKMKFELQTRNVLWRRKPERKGKPGEATLLSETTSREMHGRKFGPKDFLRKGPGDKGTELQSETGGVIEFETDGWFKKWSKLSAHLEQAVDMVKAIVDPANLIDPDTLPADERSNPRFRWPWKEHQKESELNKKTKGWLDSLRPGETLEVEEVDKDWFAAIQSSEEISLTEYKSLLKEHEREPGVAGGFIEATLKSAEEILKEANKTKGLPAADIKNLHGFLQIVVNYIIHGQRVTGDRVVKATFRLMSRTSFSSMYDVLLSDPEKELFRLIVKDRLIFKALSLDEKAKFFAGGIKTEARHLTIQAWLDSIIKPVGSVTRKAKTTSLRDKEGAKVKRDLLSHGLFGVSHAMGAFDVDPAEKELRFEVRGTRAPRPGVAQHAFPGGGLRDIRSQPLKHWVDYAESIFAHAATCRGTNLDYDQPDATRKTKFTPTTCP